MEEYVRRHPQHSGNKRCPCEKCRNAREIGCEHPGKCHKAAQKMLDSLERKWDPRQNDTLQEPIAGQGEDTKIEIPSTFNTQENLTNEFRIFAEPNRHNPNPTIRDVHMNQELVQEVTVHLAVTIVDEEFESARATGVIWYGEDDDRNETYHQLGNSVTKKGCEIDTITIALQRTLPEHDLVIRMDSEFLLRVVGQNLVKLEDHGWIGVAENDKLKVLLTNIRTQKG